MCLFSGLSNEASQFHPSLVTAFDPIKNWTKITGGQHHTLALNEEGQVFALGRKEYGRLGLGEKSEDAKEPTLITALNEKCTDVACGTSVSFAVTKSGACYAWGMGSSQLGMGDDESDIFEPKIIVGKQLEGRKVVSVSAGGQHTVLLITPNIPNGSV